VSLEAWGDEGDVFEGCPCCETEGEQFDLEHVCHCKFEEREETEHEPPSSPTLVRVAWCTYHDRAVHE
jgi:hypothetical protein